LTIERRCLDPAEPVRRAQGCVLAEQALDVQAARDQFGKGHAVMIGDSGDATEYFVLFVFGADVERRPHLGH
jgi:hypothetical protein